MKEILVTCRNCGDMMKVISLQRENNFIVVQNKENRRVKLWNKN